MNLKALILYFFLNLLVVLVSSLISVRAILFFSVYIFNDLLDLKSDRDHSKKCARPFASGSLSLFHGSIGGCIMLILGFTCAFKISLLFSIVLAIYYTSTVGYSLFLKKKPLFDIFLLTGLYTIRIIGGGVASNLEISFWLLAFSVFIF